MAAAAQRWRWSAQRPWRRRAPCRSMLPPTSCQLAACMSGSTSRARYRRTLCPAAFPEPCHLGLARLPAFLPVGMQASPRNPLLKFGEALGLGSPSSQVGVCLGALRRLLPLLPPRLRPWRVWKALRVGPAGWPAERATSQSSSCVCRETVRPHAVAALLASARPPRQPTKALPGMVIPCEGCLRPPWSHAPTPVAACATRARRTLTPLSRPRILACPSATGQR